MRLRTQVLLVTIVTVGGACQDPARTMEPDALVASLEPPGHDPARAAFADQVARVMERYRYALHDAELFEKYVERIEEDPAGAPAPSDLAQLMAILPRYPELFGEFTREADQILTLARDDAAEQIQRLNYRYQRGSTFFRRDEEPPPEDRRDALAEILAEFSPDSYVVSGEPSAILAIQPDPAVQPPFVTLQWHSLTTYGPVSVSSQVGDVVLAQFCVGAHTLCVWPIVYDLWPYAAQVLWETSTFTQQEIQSIVQEEGYHLELRVNGQLLQKGPPNGSDPSQGYYAAHVPAGPCPSGQQCLAVSLRVRDRLATIPQPWTLDLQVTELVELPFPILGPPDQFGDVAVYTHQAELVAQATKTIQQNATAGQHWFTETLYPTFKHPRCSDCHGFGGFAALAMHHGWGTATEGFVDYTNLHLKPSAYVPGGHVMACWHCHYVPLADSHGNAFHETDWIAPYVDLDIDWSQKNAGQICARVKENLPTQQLRHHHFHGDGRLFWAIEDPWVPGTALTPAPPFDFDDFLRRVDMWNVYEAPCP